MAKEYVFHYEYYPHYLGTMTRENKFDITVLDEVSDRYIEDPKDQELWDDLEEELDGYALYELVQNWPKIRKALETKGVWSGEWEEGSLAVSMTSMADARHEVAKIEAKIKQDEIEGWL